jgi:hypothetical protein
MISDFERLMDPVAPTRSTKVGSNESFVPVAAGRNTIAASYDANSRTTPLYGQKLIRDFASN